MGKLQTRRLLPGPTKGTYIEAMITEQKLTYIKKHLPYELEMLRFTHDRLKSPIERLLANALMESFAVHARNLIDFLFNHGDDGEYSARDFLPEDHPLGAKRSLGAVGKPYGRIHEEVLHMGQGRPIAQEDQVGPEERQLLRDAIESRLPKFLDAMLDDYKKKVWFPPAALDLNFIDAVQPQLHTTSAPQVFGWTGTNDPEGSKS